MADVEVVVVDMDVVAAVVVVDIDVVEVVVVLVVDVVVVVLVVDVDVVEVVGDVVVVVTGHDNVSVLQLFPSSLSDTTLVPSAQTLAESLAPEHAHV